MTDPLKLAEEIERCRPPYVNADERDARLLAAALRLAEARVAYSRLRSLPFASEVDAARRQAVETDDAFLAAKAAEAAYEQAREGK